MKQSWIQKGLRKTWHSTLGRPFGIHIRTDTGTGSPVLLIHGIASSGDSWRHIIKLLAGEPHRVITPDLLGFGNSPKPAEEWVTYDVKQHAKEVIVAVKKLHLKEPLLIVGHSMGCLIAIEIAKTHPKMVKKMVLYEPPFYDGLPKKYERRRGFYHKLYSQISKRPPLGIGKFPFVKKLVSKAIGFELSPENWIPFQRSIKNTILKQTAIADLQLTKIPTKIIYGKLDGLVIGDKKNVFFDEVADHVTSSEIAALHSISLRTGKVIAKLIQDT